MSIEDLRKKIKGFFAALPWKPQPLPDDLFLAIILILVAIGAFGLGRLSLTQGAKTPIQVENAQFMNQEEASVTPATASTPVAATSTDLVGSKNGTKYYYPWCTGVSKIAPENLIHFASKADAEARGYSPSSTCKGL